MTDREPDNAGTSALPLPSLEVEARTALEEQISFSSRPNLPAKFRATCLNLPLSASAALEPVARLLLLISAAVHRSILSRWLKRE